MLMATPERFTLKDVGGRDPDAEPTGMYSRRAKEGDTSGSAIHIL